MSKRSQSNGITLGKLRMRQIHSHPLLRKLGGNGLWLAAPVSASCIFRTTVVSYPHPPAGQRITPQTWRRVGISSNTLFAMNLIFKIAPNYHHVTIWSGCPKTHRLLTTFTITPKKGMARPARYEEIRSQLMECFKVKAPEYVPAKSEKSPVANGQAHKSQPHGN